MIAAFVLTACAGPTDQPAAEPVHTTEAGIKWVTKDGQPFDISTVSFDDSALAAFKDASVSIPGYSKTSDEALAAIGRDLCEHYAGGFTTEDLHQSGGDALAALGEAAESTVCAKP